MAGKSAGCCLYCLVPNYWDDILFGPTYSGIFSTFSFEYTTGMFAIYGGQLWVCTVPTISQPPFNLLTLTSSEWDLITDYGNNDYYQSVFDEVEYDFNNNIITSRYDADNNNLVKATFRDIFWFENDYTPIQVFQWGNNWNIMNNTGVANCKIENAYFECINWDCSLIRNIFMDGLSYVKDTFVVNNSQVISLKLHDGAEFYAFGLDNTTINNLSFESWSNAYNFGFQNSLIQRVAFSEYSGFSDTFFSNSTFEDSNFRNNAGFSNISASSSSIVIFDISNWSGFGNINMSDTRLSYFNMMNAGFGEHSLVDCNITNLSFNNAQWNGFFAEGFTYSGIQMINVQNQFIGFGYTFSGYEHGTNFNGGTIEINFIINFDGTEGNGLSGSQVFGTGSYVLPSIAFFPGYYVDSVTVYAADLIDDNGGSTFISTGIDGPEFSATVGDFSMGGVLMSSLSNGGVTGARTSGGENILMFVDNGNITSGSLSFNYVLKNPSYRYNDDSYMP